MNPAQLLNPKAFAKEKAKAGKKAQSNGSLHDPHRFITTCFTCEFTGQKKFNITCSCHHSPESTITTT